MAPMRIVGPLAEALALILVNALTASAVLAAPGLRVVRLGQPAWILLERIDLFGSGSEAGCQVQGQGVRVRARSPVA